MLLTFRLFTGNAWAQAPLEVGSPEAAFAGGPIHLSRNQLTVLRAHYQGDKVPLVPSPFRAKLDTALAGRDWPRVTAEKKALVAAHGMVAALMWEQSRFIATGSISVAEMHALDIAATGSSGLSETAVMLWFYTAAVTLTDGHKCANEAAKDAYLDRLRGPEFDPVIQLVRSIAEDRLAAMRDLAIRLEAVLAPERNDDAMCRVGNGPADVKPDALWRPEAAATRGMLPRHLLALASIMRPTPVTRPVASKPIPAPALPPPGPRVPDAPIFPGAGLNAPVLPEVVFPPPGTPRPSPPVNGGVVNRDSAQPNPAHFDPPNLELTTPANH